MATTHKQRAALVQFRIDTINKHTGENYRADYTPSYGGWELYKYDENGESRRGRFGFDLRLSDAEFIQYLEGIIRGLGIW